MKPLILFPLLLVAGIGIGGGAAFAVRTLIPPPPAAPAAAAVKAEAVATSFTPAGKILAPLVLPDGRLAGYVQIEVQLETTEANAAHVTPRLPLLLNAINMRTFRAPMASGPDGTLPNLDIFRKIVLDASVEAFGPGIVRRVAVIQAAPA